MRKNLQIATKPENPNDPAFVWNTDVKEEDITRSAVELRMLATVFFQLGDIGEEGRSLDDEFFLGVEMALRNACDVFGEVQDFYTYAREVLPRRPLTLEEEKMLAS